ncbi:hypothetical protein C0995_006250 [Termitomyces sp. Mi166|nr:hypothetical protein C0995_006250 [Termitomyces sp. Mi166\
MSPVEAHNALTIGLYMCIMNNCDTFLEQIEKCMDDFMVARSFMDPMIQTKDPIGSQVLASLAGVLFECLTRFKNSSATHPKFNVIVRRLQAWQDSWIAGISASPPDFDDPFKGTNQTGRDHITGYLRNKVERLVNIVEREQTKLEKAARRTKSVPSPNPCANRDEGILSALHLTYDGPGENSRLGIPRHDNDFVYVEDIRIAPTLEELISTATPFLPANLHGAPHPHPDETMQRLLDIQFRLLREELTAPLRTSVQLVRKDFLSQGGDKVAKSRLHEVLRQRGGKYRGVVDTQEDVMFNIYTGVEFISLIPDRRGLSVSFSFDAPPGRARSSQSRTRRAFWEGMSGKRMMQGGLIALVWKHGKQVDVHLGTLASSVKEITESVQANQDRVSARVVFFDPEIELRILHVIKDGYLQHDSTVIMVESPVMFEAIRPFLGTLKLAEPEIVPFSQYLVHRPLGYFPGPGVCPPRYARTPGFAYQLAPLFPPEAGIVDLKLHVNNQESVAIARRQLRRSRLDASQAEAIVDALTREVALIQGPPGTGKSFTGIELLRVLVKSATPILMIAFTNHALDHLLTGVLDAGITNKIVRLGGRSVDERIKKFSMEEIEQIAGRSRLDRSFARDYRALKDIEKEIQKLMQKFSQTVVPSDTITDYLAIQYPEHSEHIKFPPSWISAIFAVSLADGDAGWQTVGNQATTEGVRNIYSFWQRGADLEFLSRMSRPQPPVEPLPQPEAFPPVNKFALLKEEVADALDDNDDSDEEPPWLSSWDSPSENESSATATATATAVPVAQPETFLPAPSRSPSPAGLRISDLQDPAVFFLAHGCAQVPLVPDSNRSLDELLLEGDMWAFAIAERRKLHAYWEQQVRENIYRNNIEDFERLRGNYVRALEVCNEGKDEVISHNFFVGLVTEPSGAAKLTSLLKVWYSYNVKMNVDLWQGLGPRIMLVEEAGQVLEAHILGSLVPSVEHLILIGDPLQLRPTLNNYGLSMDSKLGRQLYKFDINRENRGVEESSSKYNDFEVQMVRDLVLYLLRQGCYSQEGDIVVLCAYLGQLARVRDALSDLVAVVIDERDQADLADQEADQEADSIGDTRVEHVKVARRVRLRTVDNYQGEEAKIIILSLVRNAGSVEDRLPRQRPTIGFLKMYRSMKSDNRTNVALSRAKEGLFILGNALQLGSRSHMWRGVIDELEQEECIGEGFPIACHRHPDTISYASKPGQLQHIAPDVCFCLICTDNSAIQTILAIWPWLVTRVAENSARDVTHVIRHAPFPADLALLKFLTSNFLVVIQAHLCHGKDTSFWIAW